MSILLCPTQALPAGLSSRVVTPLEGTRPQVWDCSGFMKFPQFMNSRWAVGDETPNAMQNILLPLPSVVKPEVSAAFRKAWWHLTLCALFGRGEEGWHCRDFRLRASRVWFRILSPSTDALCSHGEEEVPDEPMCISGICCSRRGGVKGAVSPL